MDAIKGRWIAVLWRRLQLEKEGLLSGYIESDSIFSQVRRAHYAAQCGKLLFHYLFSVLSEFDKM